MGEAKRRGTQDERAARAIAAGELRAAVDSRGGKRATRKASLWLALAAAMGAAGDNASTPKELEP